MVKDLELIKYALDVKAQNCKLLDISKISSITDEVFFCSADNERQVYAIANNILRHLPKKDLLGVDGMDNSRWVILDYGHIIAHIFHSDEFDRYRLDEVFSQAKHLPIPTELFQ